MKVVKQIDIYLKEKRNVKVIDVVQYDTGIQLVFNVKDFSIPSGTTATLYVQKRSGKFVYQEDGITVGTDTITINLENQAITEHGKTPYQVTLKNGSDEITSFTGVMIVEASLKDAGATESKTVIRAFDNAVLERVAEFRTQAEKIASAVIATIPEDYTVMTAKVNELANAIKGHLKGEIVVASDVSPVEHELDVWVHGKNIFNGELLLGYYWGSKDNLVDTKSPTYRSFEVFLKKGTYTLSASAKIYILRHYLDGLMLYPAHYGTEYTFTAEKDGIVAFSIRESTSADWDGSISLQLEGGEVSTDYSQHVEPETVTVKMCGKNICPPMGTGKTATISGMTFTGVKDGGICLEGTPTAIARYELYKGVAIAKSGFITLSLAGTFSNIIWDFQLLDAEENIIKHTQVSGGTTINLDNYPDAVYWNIGIKRKTDNVEVSGVVYPQIEVGLVATNYEAYNGTEYIPSSDGTVEGVTSLSPNMTILTDTSGVIVECEYNKDTNKVIQKICDALGIEV